MNAQTPPQNAVTRIEITCNDSHHLLEVPLEIHAYQVKKFFEQHWNKLRSTLFHLTVALPNRYPGCNILQEMVALVDADFDRAGKGMQSEIDRIDILCDVQGIDIRATYSHPESFMVQVDSPRAFRWLKMINTLDGVMRQLDTLFLMGIVKDAEKLGLTRRWTSQFRKMTKRVEIYTALYERYLADNSKNPLVELTALKDLRIQLPEPLVDSDDGAVDEVIEPVQLAKGEKEEAEASAKMSESEFRKALKDSKVA